MLDRLRSFELNKTGASNRMNRVAGRIRDEMQVKAVQHRFDSAVAG
jgi:hypothetical protein